MKASRIAARFASLQARNRAGFIPYVMAGDPDEATTLEILRALPAAGADLIELGFPFSDPMAEGVPIQRASERALRGGITTLRTLDLARAFRRFDDATPLILMGYMNNVMALGFQRFAEAAGGAGVDGLIIVDCPPEEADPLADALDPQGIALIRLAAPTTDDVRLARIARRTAGFLYYVSVTGVTGVKEADADAAAPAVARVRAASGLPVAVGFGIRTPERAAAVARIADAVVVGSALVDAGAAAVARGEPALGPVLKLAAELSAAVRAGRASKAA